MIRTATGFHKSVYAEGTDCHVILTEDCTYWLYLDQKHGWLLLWNLAGRIGGLNKATPAELSFADAECTKEKKLWKQFANPIGQLA